MAYHVAAAERDGGKYLGIIPRLNCVDAEDARTIAKRYNAHYAAKQPHVVHAMVWIDDQTGMIDWQRSDLLPRRKP